VLIGSMGIRSSNGGTIFSNIFWGISWYIPLHSLETSAKNGRYLGTSNKSVLEIARRMHIAALWLMLTWRACWPSLRRIWRDPTGPKCRQNCWIPPLNKYANQWASAGRERSMDISIYLSVYLSIYIYVSIYICFIYIYWMIQP
jgi:hypothetical protein